MSEKPFIRVRELLIDFTTFVNKNNSFLAQCLYNNYDKFAVRVLNRDSSKKSVSHAKFHAFFARREQSPPTRSVGSSDKF